MNPPSVISPDNINRLIESARAAPAGIFVEVGVYKGGSASGLANVARAQGRALHLFDTFTGIPHQDPMVDRHKVGDFGDTTLEDVRRAIPDAIFHVGVFPDTMPDELPPIALAHIDCDQFASVRACCETLAPLMVAGGVMVFDDYDCLMGAKLAVDGFFGDRVVVSNGSKARVFF